MMFHDVTAFRSPRSSTPCAIAESSLNSHLDHLHFLPIPYTVTP